MTARTIYLLRHAKSSWGDASLSDFDRPLNKRGLKARETMARYMEGRGYRPDVVFCSAAKRAVMTLDAVRPILNSDTKVTVDEGLYLADPKALAHRMENLESSVTSVMLIGHNPGFHMLALALTEPSTSAEYNALQFKYPTAALCVLQTDQPHWRPMMEKSCRLVDYALPRELAAA